MGTDINFDKILNKLKDIHKEFPDLRFGHVVQAAIDSVKKRPNIDLHDYNSKEILTSLTEFERETRSKRNKTEVKNV